MIDNDRDRLKGQQPVPPSPSEVLDALAKARDAAGAMKDYLQGQPEHIGEERSGLLSPPHTPSRGR